MKRVVKYGAILLVTVILVGIGGALYFFNLLPQRSYTAEDFYIETIKSKNDYNRNGRDDYSDIVEGARLDAANKPKYHSAYYDGG